MCVTHAETKSKRLKQTDEILNNVNLRELYSVFPASEYVNTNL